MHKSCHPALADKSDNVPESRIAKPARIRRFNASDSFSRTGPVATSSRATRASKRAADDSQHSSKYTKQVRSPDVSNAKVISRARSVTASGRPAQCAGSSSPVTDAAGAAASVGSDGPFAAYSIDPAKFTEEVLPYTARVAAALTAEKEGDKWGVNLEALRLGIRKRRLKNMDGPERDSQYYALIQKRVENIKNAIEMLLERRWQALEALQAVEADLADQKDLLAEREQHLRRSTESLEQERATLLETNEKLAEDLVKSRAETEALEHEHRTLSARVGEMEADQLQLEEDMEATRAAQAQTREALAALREEKDAVDAKLDLVTGQAEQFRAEAEAARAESDRRAAAAMAELDETREALESEKAEAAAEAAAEIARLLVRHHRIRRWYRSGWNAAVVLVHEMPLLDPV